MSYDGHPVIDTDSHLREYDDFDRTYKEYIDSAYRDQFARLSTAVHAWQRRSDDAALPDFLWPSQKPHPLGVYDDFTLPRPMVMTNNPVSNAGQTIDNETNHDPSIRLRDMDIAGVDVSVMFASQSDGFCMLHDVGFESALQRAYGRSMSAYCSGSKGRLWWLGNSNLRDINESVDQLRYWTEHDEHFAGMFISRALPNGSMLDDPALYPLFAASQELDMPIWVHGGARRPPLTPWVDAPNSLYHGLGGMYAMLALVGGGVFDLFPTLRVGIFESGAGWMPWLLEKLEKGYGPGQKDSPKMLRTAAEIVAEGRLYCSIEADEEHIEYAVETLGEEILLFSTDYPHHGTPWPEGVSMVTERKGLSESAKIKILGENALRFLPKLASGVATVNKATA